jgi:hypothetical protein
MSEFNREDIMKNLLSGSMFVCLGLIFAACSSSSSLPGEDQLKDALSKNLYLCKLYNPDIPVTQVVSAKRINSMQPAQGSNVLIVDYEANIIFPADGFIQQGDGSLVLEEIYQGDRPWEGNKAWANAHKDKCWAKGDSATIKGKLGFSKTENGWIPSGSVQISGISINRNK